MHALARGAWRRVKKPDGRGRAGAGPASRGNLAGRCLLLSLALLLALPPPARAEEEALGGMRFAAPAAASGWARSATDATGLTFRKDLPPRPDARSRGAALIGVFAPRPLRGTPFAEAFGAFTRLEALPDGRPLQTRAGVTVNRHPVAWVQRCCRARNRVYAEAHFIGIDSPRGAVFLMLVMIGTRAEDTAPLEAEFAALVRSLRPGPGDRVLDVAPASGDAGLEGAFTTLNTGLRPNAFGGMDFFSENEVLVFDRGGIYATAVPPGGRDLAAFCRERPRDCGFYRLSAGSLVTEKVMNDYGMLERAEQPLARVGADLTLGKERWRRVVPFPAGTRLDGSWRYLFASSGQGAFSSGSVAVERVLTLAADGTFMRSGFSGFSGSNETGGTRTGIVTGSRRPATSGRYRIEGMQLVLDAGDGTRETLSVFRPDPGSDRLLVIDGDNYLRRDAAPGATR
ncbi:hypothetical protein [Paracraurococcus ruber]|nr:hypothetical protein [Paracraurococcus ruber]TDG29451.1 hypothetical protein E2C05_17750 [Paracraurococcus ruber]